MRHLDRAIPLAVKARMETEWGAISITTITKIMGETDVDHRQKPTRLEKAKDQTTI